MSTTKHTPGEWRIEDDDGMPGVPQIPIVTGEPGPTHYSIALVCSQLDYQTDEFRITDTDRANACLIAAAPDLLAACRAASEALRTLHHTGDLSERQLHETHMQCNAATAKATGAA